MAKSSIQNVLGYLILISLCACAKPDQVSFSSKPIEKPTLVVPQIEPINMREIHWSVITPENSRDKFERLKNEGKPTVFFGLTPTDYGNSALNLSDIESYIAQQDRIIKAYRNYYNNSSNLN